MWPLIESERKNRHLTCKHPAHLVRTCMFFGWLMGQKCVFAKPNQNCSAGSKPCCFWPVEKSLWGLLMQKSNRKEGERWNEKDRNQTKGFQTSLTDNKTQTQNAWIMKEGSKNLRGKKEWQMHRKKCLHKTECCSWVLFFLPVLMTPLMIYVGRGVSFDLESLFTLCWCSG